MVFEFKIFQGTYHKVEHDVEHWSINPSIKILNKGPKEAIHHIFEIIRLQEMMTATQNAKK